jgi:hypothetical protein
MGFQDDQGVPDDLRPVLGDRLAEYLPVLDVRPPLGMLQVGDQVDHRPPPPGVLGRAMLLPFRKQTARTGISGVLGEAEMRSSIVRAVSMLSIADPP